MILVQHGGQVESADELSLGSTILDRLGYQSLGESIVLAGESLADGEKAGQDC